MDNENFDPVASAQAETWEHNWRQTPEGQRMNAEEVVAMIDAITEGREYVYTPDIKRPAKQIIIDTDGISFFEDFEENFDIEDPRTAREIAGALVAWANRKDSEAQVDANGNKVKRENSEAQEIHAAVWGSPARVAHKKGTQGDV